MPTLRIVARSSKIDAAHRDRISSRGSPHIRKLRISGNMRCSAYYPGNFSRVPKGNDGLRRQNVDAVDLRPVDSRNAIQLRAQIKDGSVLAFLLAFRSRTQRLRFEVYLRSQRFQVFSQLNIAVIFHNYCD